MRVSAIHDRRFPAVNSCTKCNSRVEDAIHRGCKKRSFLQPLPVFASLSALVGHNGLGDAYAVHSGGDYPARVARAFAAGVETADIGLEDIIP